MTNNPYLIPKGSDKYYGAIPGPIQSPLERLTNEQKKTLTEMRAIVEQWEMGPEDKAFTDDLCLYRYELHRLYLLTSISIIINIIIFINCDNVMVVGVMCC
jgi:hypothetical protein